MSCLTTFLLSLALITRVRGLGPADPNPAINIPVSPSIPQLVSISNITDGVELVDVAFGTIRCDGGNYGYNLDKTSCEEAWEKIPTDSAILSFGSRAKGSFERPLPYRYLSGKFRAT